MTSKNDKSKNTNKSKSLISKKTINLLQYRINEEEKSARIYLSMSLWLENEGYHNSAVLWKEFSDEENTHADWSREYLLSFGVLPKTGELPKTQSSYKSLPDIIKKSFNHEILITLQLDKLANHALDVKDNMLYTLASKYLEEQVEEHNKTQNLMDQVKSFGNNKNSMRLFDNSLAKQINSNKK